MPTRANRDTNSYGMKVGNGAQAPHTEIEDRICLNITHVIPSQMIKWYNTCSLMDGKDASVYLIDWIPTSPDVFH